MSEYLWAGLLDQAFASGMLGALMLTALVAAAVVWVLIVKRKTSKPAVWKDGRAIYAWISAVQLGEVVVLIVNSQLENVVVALTNPEYGALAQLLK